MYIGTGYGSFYELVGKASFLWHFAKYHELDAAVFQYRILLPIKLQQCRILVDRHGNPICFVSWAFLPEEEPVGNLGAQLLTEADWNAGSNMHIIDFIAPFGGVKQVIRHLKADSLRAYKEHTIWRAWRRQHGDISAKPYRISLTH